MSAPTPSRRPQPRPDQPPAAELPTRRLAPVRRAAPVVDADRYLILPARSPAGTAVDVLARVGTAVTLAALLVLTGTVLGAVHAGPVPSGTATTGR